MRVICNDGSQCLWHTLSLPRAIDSFDERWNAMHMICLFMYDFKLWVGIRSNASGCVAVLTQRMMMMKSSPRAGTLFFEHRRYHHHHARINASMNKYYARL